MSDRANIDLREMVRDLARKRDSIDRRQVYFALIQAEVWTPVTASSAVGHLCPADLYPLDYEALANGASFAFFSHQSVADAWQNTVRPSEPLRLERIAFIDLLPLFIDAGAGSVFINPEAKFTGEFYRHELETILAGARKLARRSANVTRPEPPEPGPPTGLWERITGWWK